MGRLPLLYEVPVVSGVDMSQIPLTGIDGE